jgi:hypothetical protein
MWWKTLELSDQVAWNGGRLSPFVWGLTPYKRIPLRRQAQRAGGIRDVKTRSITSNRMARSIGFET